jgi:L-fuconolactonase
VRLVDSHTHAWGPDSDEFPWRAALLPPGWEGPYTHETLVADMDATGVDEAVIVTTPLYGRDPDANDYTLASIEAHPDRLWGVGLMELFPGDPETACESVRRVTDHDRMLGVRLHAALAYAESPTEVDRHGDWVLDPAIDPVFETLGTVDSAAFVFPKAQQLGMVETLADRHPDTQFVVDHMAWPDETTAPDEEPWTAFESVADHPNTAVKVSSLPRSAKEPWPYPDLHPYVRNLVEWFGTERLMLGSDYPWMDDWAAYEQCLSWVEEVPFLSEGDLADLRYRSFERTHTDG